MILSAASLRKIKPLEPFVERGVLRGRSYGLSIAGYDVRAAYGETLHPGDFRLNSTIEKFKMPKNVLGRVLNKSTWARLGLDVFETVIEPGWEGYLTIEMVNQGYEDLEIIMGDPIAQIVFEWVDSDTDGYRGKYQNQEFGPIGARYEV